jgi:hypothetical protein
VGRFLDGLLLLVAAIPVACVVYVVIRFWPW